MLRAADRFQFRGEHEFRAWLCSVAQRKVQDRVKHLHRERRDVVREVRIQAGSSEGGPLIGALYAKVFSPSQHFIAQETAERLERAFDRLEERSRSAILLVRLDGLSYADLAVELGISESGARTLVCRGLAKLAELMDRPD